MAENENQTESEIEENTLPIDDLSEFKAANAALFTAPVTPPELDWDFAAPDEETQLHIQEVLSDLELYAGKKNGNWKTLSVSAIELAVGAPVTGVPNKELCVLIQNHASVSNADGFLNQEIWTGFLLALEKTAH